ncbi:MAG: hypothetical protein AAFX80_22935, partial [Cyanobacteria bacterium J06639_18]
SNLFVLKVGISELILIVNSDGGARMSIISFKIIFVLTVCSPAFTLPIREYSNNPLIKFSRP